MTTLFQEYSRWRKRKRFGVFRFLVPLFTILKLYLINFQTKLYEEYVFINWDLDPGVQFYMRVQLGTWWKSREDFKLLPREIMPRQHPNRHVKKISGRPQTFVAKDRHTSAPKLARVENLSSTSNFCCERSCHVSKPRNDLTTRREKYCHFSKPP